MSNSESIKKSVNRNCLDLDNDREEQVMNDIERDVKIMEQLNGLRKNICED